MEFKKLAKKFFRNPLNAISFSILVLVILIALFPSLFAPYDPLEMDGEYFMKGPAPHHLFGTDQFGRDIFSRIIFGIQKSIQISFLAVILASILGTALGVSAGYFGKWADQIIMRFIDAMFAFPAIILALFIIALFGPSVRNLIIAIGIVYTPIFARIIRSSAISIKEQLYVKAGRALGKRHFSIIMKEVIPNLFSILIVTFKPISPQRCSLRQRWDFSALVYHPLSQRLAEWWERAAIICSALPGWHFSRVSS